ncbi:MAG: DUF6659 family protein [Nitrosopumilaceae archaeon]|nr:DUF6659 family protein [Nitrosopumilaceae archaeon]
MVQLSANESQRLEQMCQQVLSIPEIRFCGIVNNQGNLIAGGFKDKIIPLEPDEKRRMLYMQMVLDFNMRKEHDETLGPIEYSATKRGKVMMISIPISDKLILISANTYADPHQISKIVAHLFSRCSNTIAA